MIIKETTVSQTNSSSDLSRKLMKAVDIKSHSEVNRLLKAGADPNLKINYFESFLHYAMEIHTDPGHKSVIKILELLLKHGAYVDKTDSSPLSLTPLCAAVIGKKGPQVVRLLLEYGANVNTSESPLNYAVVQIDDDSLAVIAEIMYYRPRRIPEECLTMLFMLDKLRFIMLIIKMTVLTHNGENGYIHHTLDLTPFVRYNLYEPSKHYFAECMRESQKLRMEIVDGGSTLWELLNDEDALDGITEFIPVDKIVREYKIYRDMIISLRRLFIERSAEKKAKEKAEEEAKELAEREAKDRAERDKARNEDKQGDDAELPAADVGEIHENEAKNEDKQGNDAETPAADVGEIPRNEDEQGNDAESPAADVGQIPINEDEQGNDAESPAADVGQIQMNMYRREVNPPKLLFKAILGDLRDEKYESYEHYMRGTTTSLERSG